MSPSPPTDSSRTRPAIVTGGARGIGRAAAQALAQAGHPVCVNDTGVALDGTDPSPEPAQRAVAALEERGGRAMASTLDVRTSAAARELVAEVQRWAGVAPTILVHAAGSLRDGMVHKASDDDWAEILGSHLSVAVELTRAVATEIRASRFGRIVYIGGAAGLVGNAGQASYVVAKAGLFGLTRAVALEMAGRDVCVNYLVPFAFTRMTESIPPVNDQLRSYLESAAQAQPADVGPLIAWLCSDAARGVSGQVLGCRGAEVAMWSQPRPVASLVDQAGWDLERLTRTARPGLEPELVPLESEFDVFANAPVPVTEGMTP
ncbi:MAG: SDR family oxidoreductase [Actinomycetota bacterium]|nr:SDR family oxidoreductase [Actinomycetota bacterium]